MHFIPGVHKDGISQTMQSAWHAKISGMAQALQQTPPVRQDKICQQSALKLPCVLKGKQGLLAAVVSRRRWIAMQSKPDS